MERLQHLQALVAAGVKFLVELAHVRRLRTALRENHQHFTSLANCVLRNLINGGIVHFKHFFDRFSEPFMKLVETFTIERVESAPTVRLEMRQNLHLFLDEVHHLGKDWSLVVKNIADQFRKINIVYSGSSLLQLEKASGDLPRRQSTYTLNGMSFREYLELEGILEHKPLTLDEIISDHVHIATAIDEKLKVLPHFETYRRSGFYPFYRESLRKFHERLAETVKKVLEVDYPAIDEVSQDTIRKTRKMLMILSECCPQTPNMSKLYKELDTGRDQGLKMLKALQRAGLLALLDAKGLKLDDLSKP